ncbi:acyltransferase [Abyssisolibacter fermentans]|uniref:acyltransferase n=1 Tax=Abyssisolibacter fermentans TaxID=1766203 RepID=UPI000835A394|nr:acyltransferase [Abyssisolibacter fermentans]
MTDVFISEKAIVDESVIIGRGTKIWHFTQIIRNVTIGTNCKIGKNVFIDHDITIGDNVKIQNNVNIYHGVIIEDDVFLGPSMTFTNDMFPRSNNHDFKVVSTKVSKGASIGANATIICGVNIGEYSMIGAGAVVTKDVKPYSIVVGNPAKTIGYVCICGNRLNEKLKCSICHRDYHDKIKALKCID